MEMTYDEMYEKCLVYFDKLVTLLGDSYEQVGSCNKDRSLYLVPKGTANQVTYESKPIWSFRVSDHWNWYANIKKCPNRNYIQCYTRDLPHAMKRQLPDGASKPIWGSMVAVFGPDQRYYCVYGEKWNKFTREYTFFESDPEQVATAIDIRRNSILDYKEALDYVQVFKSGLAFSGR